MTNFGFINMAAVVVGKGGGGKPPLLFTLKAIPFKQTAMTETRIQQTPL